jgi:tetratricopeptide (TPR) repeat protein
MSERVPDTPDELARRLAAAATRRRPVRVTLRELRDDLGRQSLSTATRIELSDALRRARLEASPPLERLQLDDVVELRALRLRRLRALGRRGIAAVEPVGIVIGLVLGLVTIAAFVITRLDDPPAPRPMSGDVNVLVAPFDARGTAGARDGTALADTAARALRESTGDAGPAADAGLGLDVQVRGPNGVGAVRGATPARRAAEAARLAAAHEADLVVFGTVTASARASRVEPELYVSDDKLPDADELAGTYRLPAVVGPGGSFDDAIVGRRALRATLARRVDGLSAFVDGLGWFQARDWARARERFARAAAEVPDAPGAFVLLFEGNAAGRLGDLTGAARAYRRAVAAQPTLLRASVGLAEVAFQRAHGGCAPRTADGPALRQVAQRFRRILGQVEGDVPLVVAVRAHFGLGRVLMCASQAGVLDAWAPADQQLRRALALADGADPVRFRDERAEAHAGLGLIALPTVRAGGGGGRGARDPATRTAYERALAEYRRALAISRDPARDATYLGMIAFVHKRLGQSEEAARAAARARRLDRLAARGRDAIGAP